jgi:hypothetical protein
MKPIIQVQTRPVYGTFNIYPVCDRAHAFAKIAGTKTLTIDVCEQIKALGYDIVNLPVATTFDEFFGSK